MKILLFFLALSAYGQYVWNPFTNNLDRVGGGSGTGAAPYSAAVTAQTTLTVTAATHLQGTTPAAFCDDGAGPFTGGICGISYATNGDVTFTWSPAFTGRVKILGGGTGATGATGPAGATGATGPSGLLSGTLAAIPATCTPGVSLYQATDQAVGAQLRVCTSANTWTISVSASTLSGSGTGVNTFLVTPSSANLLAALTDETGTGVAVFNNGPTLIGPILGTPASGVMTNVTGLPLTTGVIGTLGPTNGGTGTATYTQGDLLYSDASNSLAKLAKNTSATRYLSNTGASNAPAWAQVDLTNGVNGALPVVNGGTGLSSGTSGGILGYTASGTLASSAALTAGALLVGGGAGALPAVLANSSVPNAGELKIGTQNANASATRAVFNVGPTALSGLSASGTYIAVNAETAFGGNLIDLRTNSSGRFSVTGAGAATFAGGVTATAFIVSGTSMQLINTGLDLTNNNGQFVGNFSSGSAATLTIVGSSGTASSNFLALRGTFGGSSPNQLRINGDQKAVMIGQTVSTTSLSDTTAQFGDRTATTGITRVLIEGAPGQSTNSMFVWKGYNATSDTGTTLGQINSEGRLIAGGTAPTVSSCGTSPTIAGFNEAGRVTIGTGGVATSCTVTFGGTAWVTKPSCTGSNETTTLYARFTATTTTLTITSATPFGASDEIAFVCKGY